MGKTGDHLYIIALGSNRALSAGLSSRAILHAATEALGDAGRQVLAIAPIRTTAPIGPSRRRYANSALLLASPLLPQALLLQLQSIERRFGRRRARRWGARTLDLDIILWSGGAWAGHKLIVPHSAYRSRDFVLQPLLDIAPDWRDPVSGLRPAHLLARLKKSSL